MTVTAMLAALAVLAWPDRGRLLPVGAGGALTAAHEQPAPEVRLTADVLLSVVEMISAQVRAGAAPATAWRHSLDVLGLPSPGPSGDPLAWWDHAGRTSPAARSAGAAWRLAETTGAPLADVLDGVASTLREQQALADDLAAALAGPRATVHLLTVLPLGGVLLGELIGARPTHVLLGTGVGRWCAVLGAVLLLLGRWWMGRMVRAVAGAA